jgi:alkylation response protein AidB-like acyl-CoA dehydrogenase
VGEGSRARGGSGRQAVERSRVDFRFDDEQLAFRDAVRDLCRQHFDLVAVATREGVPITDAAWRALGDMGVLGMLAPGAGGAVEAAIAFEQLGAHVANGPRRWTTLAAPMLGDDASRVTGIDLVGAPAAPFVVENVEESDMLVMLHADRVEQCSVRELGETVGATALDPLTATRAFTALPGGLVIGGPDDARRMRLAGIILAAAELVGAAQGALDVAREYALEREQFGVVIGSFQAVKHMLADMYVRVELARSATYAAAAIYDEESAGDAEAAASVAKLLAGEAGISNGRTAIQVLGGMGFTWEMLPHYFLKRAWLLEHAFGTADVHALALGTTVASWT